MMLQVCEPTDCCGCQACASVCPKGCITYHADKVGHLIPRIDTGLCIDCKRCQRVCPALNEPEYNTPSAAIAAFAKDDSIYAASTSGGAATMLSQAVIRGGGIVYGSACMPGADVRHIRIDNEESLHLLAGSKYVQSDMSHIYDDLRRDIKSGRTVLFIGTPCQSSAVKRLFAKEPENLVRVELICHGTPSAQSLHAYLHKRVRDVSSIVRLRFRTPDGYQIEACAGDNEESVIYKSTPISVNRYGDPYYTCFFHGYSFRDSCYKCRFARPERNSDITIGDFWGFGREGGAGQFNDHPKGLSLIMPCTDKGRALFDAIKGTCNYTGRPLSEAVAGNSQLRKPVALTFRRRMARRLAPYIGMKAAFNLMNIDHLIRYSIRRLISK